MSEKKTGIIYGINGPVVYLKGNTGFKMSEMVYVGEEHLVGEVIGLTRDTTTIQVFEETTGLRPGAMVEATGDAISVLLGPGILNNIFDGIERPLSEIAKQSGKYITRGVNVDSLDTQKKWPVTMKVAPGDTVMGGTIIAETPETQSIIHKSMVPPAVHQATVTWVAPDGDYTILDPIVRLELHDGTEQEISLCQKWPIRIPRPTAKRYPASEPLITGQRILDTMFPIAKGGTAAIPGGFGTGKTMTQHQIAKWSNADIIIYIGCGERGNEMTQVLEEFSELVDPRSGNLLMDRTALIANTSNMPVAAREASIYTGLTLAEYYRDMGYDVAIMADSTSRWAEALRELSGRLEEMPAEEGYPAYLASRLSAFYERAGMMQNLNGTEGSVSIIGAVSPQGGDFSEPVTMNTKRYVRCFWGLDKSLAYARHFPAIHWLTSYSEYLGDLSPWYKDHVNKNFVDDRNQIMGLLNQESSLMEIVKLIGGDVLPDDQKLVLEIARVIRLGFLQQNAFHKDDTCVPLIKQFQMMETILYLYKKSKALVTMGHPMSVLKESDIFDRVISIKYDVPNDKPEQFADYKKAIDKFYDEVLEKNA
ncbi:V-type ATP synthase subunit A [Wansuia hejianensis]|uniref:V-type ATP synthase alpha chain n=1 Tax=Wansuia hejianensis TaxID=2763667 RepID=A0A7G9GAF5_9FIRM|nr:V-type ATP synthase subunit A [Wansuia hejianensis]QNM07787.1 V-type ATP synthase subunit A [Wansuia hejianensis]RHV85754.1 V-type ATP synthase subunit A [Lachnospiraceae bacterium OF09-33XD]